MKSAFRTVTLLFTCLFTLAAAPAFADRAEDHEAITALMWHYARALDTFNPQAYAAVYTEDGEFASGNTASTKGRKALYDMVAGLRKGREDRAAAGEAVPTMYHMTTDTWIEFIDDTHARHHSYWLTATVTAGSGTQVLAVGRGVDDVVKVDGGWLIRSRNVAPQD